MKTCVRCPQCGQCRTVNCEASIAFFLLGGDELAIGMGRCRLSHAKFQSLLRRVERVVCAARRCHVGEMSLMDRHPAVFLRWIPVVLCVPRWFGERWLCFVVRHEGAGDIAIVGLRSRVDPGLSCLGVDNIVNSVPRGKLEGPSRWVLSPSAALR